jgi:EmrB/QacA subfamily drug resistance transporter
MVTEVSAARPGLTGGLSRRRRIGILLICSMSLFLVGLDVTIVNVALPSIGRAFRTPLPGLQWTVDAYTVVLASLLILSGSTADRFGRRRMFVAGLLIFGAGSVLCSLAPSLTTLVIFRMVQGVGGSMLSPVALAIVTNIFTIPGERAQAIGVWAAVNGIAMALGPVAGGLLVTLAGWRSIFWVNIPVALAAEILTLRFTPESKAPAPRQADVPGQVLVIMVLGSLTYGIIEGPALGWASPLIAGALTVAAGSLAAFLAWERQASEPLIDLRFFRSVPFSSATAMALFAFAALGGFLFLNTVYLQDVRGLSAIQAGIDTLPLASMAIIFPPVSGRMTGRRGARIPLAIAGTALSASCFLLAGLSATTPFTWLFTAYVIFGIGYGLVNPPITNAAVSGMPRAQAGAAAAITSSARQVGQTLGVAVAGSLVPASVTTTGHLSFALASRAAWWVLAGCGAAVLVLGQVATSRRAVATARRTAENLNPEYLQGHAP